jgi:hypothetical protein
MEWCCWFTGSERSLQVYVESLMNNDLQRQGSESDKSRL